MQLRTLVALVAFGASWGFVRAENFSTVNAEKLDPFKQLLESRSRPVRILSFGDSMADSYRSATYYFIRQLEQKYGAAGYAFNNYANTLGIALTNGTQLTDLNSNWFNRYYTLPPGAAVWWEREWSPGGNRCDQVGLFYLARPAGGLLTLSVSTNTGPWSTVLTLDCYHPTTVGRFTNVALAPNLYRVRAQSQQGTNLVLGPFVELSTTNGIHISFMDWPGIALDQVTNVPRAIRDPILAALKPDLLIWHMKENGGTYITNCLRDCEDWWQAANPAGQVLYLGSTWVNYDTNAEVTVEQNRAVRGVALEHQRCYVDLMQPSISYSWLVGMGFMQDNVHLNKSGGQWCAGVMWDDLGFFALGLPRSLSLQRLDDQWFVRYLTATSATYTVETSTNLIHWLGVASGKGDGQMRTNFFPGVTNTFFRLKLQPPGA